ncbi:HECTD2 [Acanthosepion pharaonis]|uniref:HECT-type E3 ubiquitin transferase n=1 Tax=Acanthosepion pharaonis TaxID=158019 RepID=A0A812C0A5_ACAPH|nr:HECTD2 [Sepia pharaonis]
MMCKTFASSFSSFCTSIHFQKEIAFFSFQCERRPLDMLSSLLRQALPPRLHSRRSTASATTPSSSSASTPMLPKQPSHSTTPTPSIPHRRRRRRHRNTELPPIAPDATKAETLSAYAPHSEEGSEKNAGNPPAAKQTPSMHLIKARQLKYLSEIEPETLREMFYVGKSSSQWKEMKEYCLTIFESFNNMVAIFKVKDLGTSYLSSDCILRKEMLDVTYDLITELPSEIQRLILKSIVNCLLTDRRTSSTDSLRAYYILLLNPMFDSTQTFGIFAHLLRQVASLTDQEHHYLVHWIKELQSTEFKSIINRLNSFITWKMFPNRPQDLPHPSKCTWWVPSAVKVMALFNAANNLVRPHIVPFEDFYNNSLERCDLLSEYYKWQNVYSHGGFSFCQYPFILSIGAKRSILQRDSEQQMIVMARKSLVDNVQKRQLPDIGMLFLNLKVRRSNLVSDSLNEIASKQSELKKKLKVTFAGEPGLDMGGLTKEWFLLLIRQIFDPDYGMFTFDKKAGVYWFSSAPCTNYQEFRLVGVLMGLAVYNSIMLDIRFPACCYKKLLSPAVVPYNNPKMPVGVAQLTLQDLQLVHPDIANGLKELLEYEGDVQEDFGLTFQVSYTELGCVKTHPLKTNGENIFVTNSNRGGYVQLYVDWILNKSVYEMFKEFYHGFHSVCASNALIMLRPEEVEMLVCGCPTLDLNELKAVATYDGYTSLDVTIKYFWDVVLKFPLEFQKKLLLFTTGSDRVPIGGTADMTFKITKVDDTSLLPMSHTCFNQLVLPTYKNKKTLRAKLLTAIQNAEGFGLE